ncbi:hypothetical protein [Paraburkholderia youngii]|uniref:hypothetical protein n=1 Tax=Paraburkholderia youngii TaxID=2782701 RepID=UPI003D1A1B5F
MAESVLGFVCLGRLNHSGSACLRSLHATVYVVSIIAAIDRKAWGEKEGKTQGISPWQSRIAWKAPGRYARAVHSQADWIDLSVMHGSRLERVRRIAAKLEASCPAPAQ